MALFGLPYIRLVRLLFSAGTVFFSHNNSAETVFFSQFQPRFRPANGAFVQRMKPIDSICSLLILCQDTYGQWWDAKLWCYWFTNHLGLLAAVEIADPFVLCSYYYHAAGSSFRSTRNSDPSLDQSLVCWSAGGVATSSKLLLPIHVDVT